MAKKPAPEPVKEEDPEPSQPEASTSKQDHAADTPIDPEEQKAAIEKQLLQQLAERVRPMVQKEVSRLTKMYDYERRLARNYPMFAWPKPDIQQRVLDLALASSQNGKFKRCLLGMHLLNIEIPESPTHRPAGVTDDKLISKALTIYGTLERFGFSKERIDECLRSIKNLELEDALEWLILHCPEKELLFDAANSLSALVAEAEPEDESLASGMTTPAEFPPMSSGTTTPLKNAPASSKKSKKQSTTASSGDLASVPLAQEDVDAIRDKPTAAYVSAKLELLSIQRKLISETTRTTVQLESIVSQASKAYLFDKRDADAAVNMARGELDERVRDMRATSRAEEASKREKEIQEQQQQEAPESKDRHATTDAEQTQKATPVASDKKEESRETIAEGSDDEMGADGLFGNMLDEMPTEEIDEITNTTIKVRPMPLPKQYAGKPPKLLLEDVVRRKDKFAARPVFSTVSSGTRAKRATVTLRWDSGTQQVFTMQDEACPDQAQAYNYVATMALFAIDTGSIGRQLAPAFRELWDELEAARKEQDEEAYRSYLKQVKTLVEPRLKLPVSLILIIR